MVNKLPELLAPAGSPQALRAVIEAGADAVYVAGKKFGMRQHAAWLNFDEHTLATAIEFAHRRGRRIYVTVNNLLTDVELQETDAFIDLLASWRVDALIVQDLGFLQRMKRRRLGMELHASCMMNTHSTGTAKVLGGLGVSRIIPSRDITLVDAARLQRESEIEFEYFVHGDMCIAQSGQCVTSGIMAGESSSRGRCLKPCRWEWELIDANGEGVRDGAGFLMARKDLCLFEHIPALVHSGIAALKIEGRARSPEFLAGLVAAYRQALDAYADDPEHYATDSRLVEDLNANRIRDFTTCMTFGKPGMDGIGRDGAREPRIFSAVIEQPPLDADLPIPSAPTNSAYSPELVVHCGSVEATETALDAGAQGVCIGGELWRTGGSLFTPAEVEAVRERALRKGAKLYGMAPRVSEKDELTDGALPHLDTDLFDAYYVHTLGQLHQTRERRVRPIADLGFNLVNADAFEMIAGLGAIRGVVSLELGLSQIARMAPNVNETMEFIIHGPMVGMITEHCFAEAEVECTADMRASGRPPCASGMALRDAAGQVHRILTDTRCRNHVLLPRHLCALPLLGELCSLRPAAVRIDCRHDSPRVLGEIVNVYRAALDNLAGGIDPPSDGLHRLIRCVPSGLTLGVLDLVVADEALPGPSLPTNEWVCPQRMMCGESTSTTC